MEGGLSQFMFIYNKLLTATPFVPVNGTAVGLGNFLKGQRVDKKAIKKSYYETREKGKGIVLRNQLAVLLFKGLNKDTY